MSFKAGCTLLVHGMRNRKCTYRPVIDLRPWVTLDLFQCDLDRVPGRFPLVNLEMVGDPHIHLTIGSSRGFPECTPIQLTSYIHKNNLKRKEVTEIQHTKFVNNRYLIGLSFIESRYLTISLNLKLLQKFFLHISAWNVGILRWNVWKTWNAQISAEMQCEMHENEKPYQIW